jgi:hypothetical protein
MGIQMSVEKYMYTCTQKIYTRKYHNEALCIDILIKNVFFSETEDRKAKGVLSGGFYQWEGEDIRKGDSRVNVVEIFCTQI